VDEGAPVLVHRVVLVLSLWSSLVLPACGGAKAGDKCTAAGYLCADATTALECKLGAYVALPCRGSAGCKAIGNLIRCDMSGNAAGDACASSSAGKGLCTSDQQHTLECREDPATSQLHLVQTKDCQTCTVNGDLVVCQP
jgi:hypothetical protein